MSNSVLIIEDSPEYQIFLKSALQSDYLVYTANGATDAKSILDKYKIELILLDICLADEDGLSLCSEIKSHPKTCEIPVLFITSKSETMDKVLGLSIGADDYIVKPIDPLELQARVKSVFRRLNLQKRKSNFVEKSGIKIDFTAQKVFFTESDKLSNPELTSKEFKILSLLMLNSNQVLTREKILNDVWGHGFNITDRTVDTHIHTLRKKLGSKSEVIQAVTGTGYRFSEDFK